MNILIINLHSARNLGDDAIMYETIKGLNEVFPSAKLTLAATDPESWNKYCNEVNVEVIGSFTTLVTYIKNGRWRSRLGAAIIFIPATILAALLYRFFKVKFLFGSPQKRRLLSAYYDADLVVSCGGGNFYAHFWCSPFFLLSLLALGTAVIMGKHVIMLPQSIGPIKGWLQRWLAKALLSRVDKIMVRECYSLDFVQRVLHLKERVVLIPDLAFAPTPIGSFPHMQNTYPGLKIGVTVIDRATQTRGKAFTFSQQSAYEESLVYALTKISGRYCVMIYLFPQCTGPDLAHDDRRVLQRVYSRLREQNVPVVLLKEFDGFLDLKAAYAHMDCIIGSRMHTAVFALSLGIPVILIAYQPKSSGIMKQFGLERFCYDIATLEGDRLVFAISELLKNREQIRQAIQERYNKLQDELRKWRREVVQ